MAAEFIQRLPLWQHAIAVEALSGGITNQNFLVTDGGRKYAVRRAEDNLPLGISRRNELTCIRAAAELGVAPPIAYSEGGVTVCDFVDGEPLTAETGRDPDRFSRVAQALRVIHGSGAKVSGHMQYFCPFQVARTYVAEARGRGLPLPADGDELLERVADLQTRVPPFSPTFCHNDLMPGNVLDTGSRVWLVDWEYAGIGNPLFDLAGFASNCELDTAADRAWLAAYFGDSANRQEAPFRVMKAMAALRESLWGVIQGSQSQIDFDYDAYRDENYRRFLLALDAIERT